MFNDKFKASCVLIRTSIYPRKQLIKVLSSLSKLYISIISSKVFLPLNKSLTENSFK